MNPTIVFCTSYAESIEKWEYRWRRWFNAVKRSRLHYDQLLIVDDGSPVVPQWDEFITVQEGDEIPNDASCVLYRFKVRFGQHRGSTAPFPGWYRSFGFATNYAIERGAKKLVHIESDAFLISDRAYDYFNSIERGWIALFCPVHNIPESTLQIIGNDRLALAAQFFSQNYSAYQGQVIERVLPFTLVNKDLIGDRYGEFASNIPQGVDFASQCRWDQDSSYFWWL